jgi:hypothetical protein
MQVREHKSDPIFVEGVGPEDRRHVSLRIGKAKRGESRYAVLTPKEARLLALALMTEAERAAQ